MRIILHLLFIVGSYSLSIDNEKKKSDQSPNVSNSLQEILNRESLVRLSMVQKMQTLMLDAVDSRKKDEMLTDNFISFKKEFQALKEENEKYKEEFKKVHDTLNLYFAVIRELNATQADEISELSSLKNNYLNFTVAVNETFKRIQDNQTAHDIQLKKIFSQEQSGSFQEIPGNYAFYAQLTSPASNNYVVFDNVTTNEGSAYDGTTGIFTCKYDGSYVFSWTIATSSHRYTEAQLLVNDKVIGSSGTDSRPASDTADSSTGFVVYNLQLGDKVRIRVNGTADGIYSTFSGWRLTESHSSFYAKATSLLQRPSSSSQGYPFESLVNNGIVYDQNYGTFTCPENGLYAFAATVETKNDKGFPVYFYQDGNKLSAIPIQPDASPGTYFDTSSSLQIFSLSKGDKIYIFSTDSDSSIEPMHSTFSGWRIALNLNISAFMEYTTIDMTSSPMDYNKEHLDTRSSFYKTYFEAPEDGVFLFFWHMHAYNIRLESFLQVNGETVGQTIGDARSSDYEGSSNLAILRLRKNDNVKVTHDGKADEDQTMISGYFLFP